MNCVEFQEFLTESGDSQLKAEQQTHLHSCAECASLFSDLNEITSTARLLQAVDEPSPRVWNSIEIALRQEGLIREVQRGPVLVPRHVSRWKLAWLVPVAALVLVAFGVGIYQRSAPVANLQNGVSNIGSPDDQVLQEVAERTPALRATYAADLQNVNSYIEAAQAELKSDPNDEDARQSLMQAYEQRSMVYAMAADRSLP